MESKTERNSAIELLRILSMVAIVVHHYSTEPDWGVWTAANYSFNVLFLQLMAPGGLVANNVFLLITGYYTIKSGVRLKNILRLLAELFFYSWTIAIILYGFRIIPFSIKGAIKAAVPIWFGYNWYVCCYILFCCFIPFLNMFLNTITRKTYLRLLIVAFFIESFMPTFKGTSYMGDGFCIDHFAIMYMLGGYIRIYGFETKHIKSWWKAFGMILALFMLSIIVLSLGGYTIKSNFLIQHARHFTYMTAILNVLLSTALFLAVLEFVPFHCPHINQLAGSMVGIFLIHHNPLLRPIIWEMLSPNVNYLHSPWLPVHMLVKVTAVFTVCLAIDLLRRRFLEPPFSRWLDRALASPAAAKVRRVYDRLTDSM